MISQKNIGEIFEAAKIEEVVGDYITLKKRGVNLLGVCPFHHEKTPSFTVSPAKNIYKCFGCGNGGNAVNFIMEHENMTYPEALRHLAAKYNIELDEIQTTDEQRQEKQLYDSLYLITEYAKDFYQKQLFETEEGKSIGLSYFKERGFREEILKKFGLGYAPNTKNAFTLNAINTGYKPEMLIQAGLTSKDGNRDFFRNRVQFAIHNLTGKVVGFGGRIMSKDVKAPKYINTPESEIYNKSKVLYGAFFARRAIRQFDECILVEGYTDVISLHQAGIEHVVASSGTSLTEGQIGLIKRYTPNIKILYDGDPAGVKAALRGLDLVLEQDMNVKIVLLPDKEDPDSYLQKVGITVFQEYIDSNAQDFILFKTNLLLEEAKGDPIKKTNLIKDIVNSIAKIPDPLKRSVFVKECATRLEVDEGVLVAETNKVTLAEMNKRKKRADRERDNTPPPDFLPEQGPAIQQPPSKKMVLDDQIREKHLIGLLMAYGEEKMEEEVTVAHYILSNIEEVIDEIDNDLCKFIIYECLERLKSQKSLSQEYFIRHHNPEINKLAVAALTTPYEYSKNWEEKHLNPLQTQPMPEKNYVKDTKNSMDRLKWSKAKRLNIKLTSQIKEAQDNNDMDKVLKLMKVQMKMKKIEQEYSEILNTNGAIR